jgi:hypothetical protein
MLDPFARNYEACNKCQGRTKLQTESLSNGSQKTFQVCRKCNSKILTAQVNIIRVPNTGARK